MKNNIIISIGILISSLSLYSMGDLTLKVLTSKELLLRAAEQAHPNALEKLLKNNSIKTTDVKGNSLVILSLTKPPYTEKHARTLECLLNQPDGASLANQIGEDKFTPLQILINGLTKEESKDLPEEERKTRIGFGIRMLNALLAHGANPYAEGYNQQNTFALAHELKLPELVPFIQKKYENYLKTTDSPKAIYHTVTRPRRPSFDNLSVDLEKYWGTQPSQEETSSDETLDNLEKALFKYFDTSSTTEKASDETTASFEIQSTSCCDIL